MSEWHVGAEGWQAYAAGRLGNNCVGGDNQYCVVLQTLRLNGCHDGHPVSAGQSGLR